EDNPELLGGCRKSGRRRAGNWFGEIEQGYIFALTEILRLKKFGQADDLRALRGSLANALDRVLQILLRVRRHRHLYQADAEFIRRQNAGSFWDKIEYQFPILSSQSQRW